MDLARLEDLKKILVEAKNLQSIYEYFLDHFGENDAFLDLGKPKRHPVLEQFIGAIAGEIFGGKAVAASFLLIPVPKTHFVHGACRLNGRPANVIYFEDIEVGLLGVMMGSPDGMTNWSRFSGRKLPPEGVPHEN